jgi:hypothetical protein
VSRATRRLQRRGHPVVGEQLEGVQAHYRNAKGDAFTLQVDSQTGVDMMQLYRHLTEIVSEHAEVKEAFEQLDAIAGESWLKKKRLPIQRAITAVLNVYWLASRLSGDR